MLASCASLSTAYTDCVLGDCFCFLALQRCVSWMLQPEAIKQEEQGAQQQEAEDPHAADAHMAEAAGEEEEQEGSEDRPAENGDAYEAQDYEDAYQEETQGAAEDYDLDVYDDAAAAEEGGAHIRLSS